MAESSSFALGSKAEFYSQCFMYFVCFLYSITSVSMESATQANTGREQAYLVERCECPVGYTGQSCEVSNPWSKIKVQKISDPCTFSKYKFCVQK